MHGIELKCTAIDSLETLSLAMILTANVVKFNVALALTSAHANFQGNSTVIVVYVYDISVHTANIQIVFVAFAFIEYYLKSGTRESDAYMKQFSCLYAVRSIQLNSFVPYALAKPEQSCRATDFVSVLFTNFYSIW